METVLGGLLIGGTNVWMVTAIKEESNEIFKILQEAHLKTSDNPEETMILIAEFYN